MTDSKMRVLEGLATQLAIASSIAALLLGCAGSGRKLPAEPALRAGFLGDYSQLAPGRADQARLSYIDPAADFSLYERIVIDPVVVWKGAGSSLGSAPAEELAAHAKYFGDALRRELDVEYKIVDEAAAGTMRLRVAITRFQTHPETGAAQDVGIEVELLDASSGRRLIAAADEHEAVQSSTTDPDATDAQSIDVRAVFDDWAHRASVRLSALRNFDEKQIRGEEGS